LHSIYDVTNYQSFHCDEKRKEKRKSKRGIKKMTIQKIIREMMPARTSKSLYRTFESIAHEAMILYQNL
jgi:histone H3/H4